ncbi:MAG: hypothetical protein N3F07_01740 [Candidatus Micrarchaeota archaeon]|nr:hypothetical protein [Candidatus Micrarchaeota archaeon]
MQRAWRAFALILLLVSPGLSATSPPNKVTAAISALCSDLTSLLPVVSMLMVVLGSVVYAAGQMMGAETRARANVWATAALTGAIIALLISTVTPPVLSAMYGKTVSCTGAAPAPPQNNCGTVNCSGSTPKCCSSGSSYWCCSSSQSCGSSTSPCVGAET